MDIDTKTLLTDNGGQAPQLESVELTILMPCLNEAETLERCIRKANAFLKENAIDGEVVIGDNGSTDGSQQIARNCGALVVSVPVRGYGAALYYGVMASKGRYVIMGDSDDSYDFSNLGVFVEKLRQNYDLVMGNRFLGGIKPGAMPWKNRWIGNPILSGIGRLFFNCPARDFHCGLRGFSRSAFLRMDLRTTGMEFASEMVIKATLFGMKIAEVPTTLSPDGRSRPPHLRPWRDGWRHLRFMLLYSPRWLFLYPGMLLMLCGLVLGSLILLGPLYIGKVGLDVSTLIYASAAVIIGFQMICFAVFTKVFAISEGLLAEDPKMSKLFKYITLESGIAVGGFLTLAGLCISAYALHYWQRFNFGALNPKDILRLVVPAVTLLALGCEIVLASFFLSVLGLRLRRAR